MTPREVERIITDAGWEHLPGRGRGSHRVYVHPRIAGGIVIPWHAGVDLRKGTVLSILRKAGLR